MKKLIVFCSLALCSTAIFADDTIRVERAKYAGEYKVNRPVVLDSLQLDKTKYSDSKLLESPLSFSPLKTAKVVDLNSLPVTADTKSVNLNLLSFNFSLESFAKVEVRVDGVSQHKIFVSGKETASAESYTPGEYEVVVKYVTDSVAPKVSVISGQPVTVSAGNQKRLFNLDDNMEMKYITSASLSPSGKYATAKWRYFDHTGKIQQKECIRELATGRIVSHSVPGSWMTHEDKLYFVETEDGEKTLWTLDIATGNKTAVARNLPADDVTLSSSGDYLIYHISNEGPEKPKDVFEVKHPDDRQPGYRTRYSLGLYDLRTGLAETLTYGSENTWLSDISADGRYILFSVSSDSITAPRPSELQSLYRLDLQTRCVDTLYYKEGFIAQAKFFPNDCERVLVQASPEAFNGVGKDVPEGMTPNMYDYQLYCLSAGVVTPLTCDFNPSVSDLEISLSDSQIYFTAEDRDLVSLFRLDPRTLKISRVSQPMEDLSGITTAADSQTMLLWGTSFDVPSRLYSLKAPLSSKSKPQLLLDPNSERMEELAVSECKPLSFTCKRGYEVTGFYSLPSNFDPEKKYPMIVHYYGGCSPTSRRFGGGSHYPAHYWNALGYVVLIVNPSGASGFGQEWAARHVNTVGEGVAEDIIEATEYLADSCPFINKEKIGCVSASYGGFMTQLLLSKTDLFACGISHAGISDHTSYWGEGYWGYSYSEVSMANSYPWTRKDLYVDGSPLFNADKIHKPLLFTHGSADTNVPVGESIQMYTALKILGVPTAFILVEGENHGIMDYGKRRKWINAMLAWFQKWLKDDPSWWEEGSEK